MIEHMVLVRVRPDATADAVTETFAALAALVGVVPGLERFRGGANVSPEGLARGYTHGLVMTFTDAAARDGYIKHPAHIAAARKLLRIAEGAVAGVLVVDVEG